MSRRLRATAAATTTTVLVALVVGLGISSASAATLAVTAAPEASLSTVAACAPAMSEGAPVIDSDAAGTLNVGTYPQVVLNGIPPECSGLPLDVFVHDAAGNVLASAAGATAAESVTVDVGTYTGAAAANLVLGIDGWIFATDWTVPLPDGPIACYLIDDAGDVATDAQGIPVRCDNPPRLVNVNAWPGTLQVDYEAIADSSVLLVFDFSDPVYAGYDGDVATSSVTLIGYNGSNQLRDSDDCSAMPGLEVIANHPNPEWGAQPLSGAVTLTSTSQSGAVCG